MEIIFKLKEFKKECFPAKELSAQQIINLKIKIHKFNISNNTNFWIDFSDYIGQSGTKIVLAIRISGEGSQLVYVKDFKNKYKNVFKEKLQRLIEEIKSYIPSKKEKKVVTIEKNSTQQLNFGF